VLDLVLTLKAQNVPVIIISHQIHDVFSVADRVVVMRRGKKAGERLVKETSLDEVVGLIVGSVEG
jgi:ABC-type sugar transport system ATPase subunit